MRLSDSELKVMDALWRSGALSAKELAEQLSAQIGWNKNTTYTLIKRLVDKGAIERAEPGFVSRPLADRAKVERAQAGERVDTRFGGSAARLFAALVDDRPLPPEEVDALRRMIDEMR